MRRVLLVEHGRRLGRAVPKRILITVAQLVEALPLECCINPYIYIYIYIYIYMYDFSSLRVNNLTLILLTWRKW